MNARFFALALAAAVLSLATGCYESHPASGPRDGGSSTTCGPTACPPGERCCPVCGAAPVCMSERVVCPPAPCTCRGSVDCPLGEYCRTPTGVCGGEGMCERMPRECLREPRVEACGCDGVTYRNGCEAAALGVSVERVGFCAPPPGANCASVCEWLVRAPCGPGGDFTSCIEECAPAAADCTPEDWERVGVCLEDPDCGAAVTCLISSAPCLQE